MSNQQMNREETGKQAIIRAYCLFKMTKKNRITKMKGMSRELTSIRSFIESDNVGFIVLSYSSYRGCKSPKFIYDSWAQKPVKYYRHYTCDQSMSETINYIYHCIYLYKRYFLTCTGIIYSFVKPFRIVMSGRSRPNFQKPIVSNASSWKGPATSTLQIG